MSHQMFINIFVGLAALFAVLWLFSNWQKRKFEKASRARRKELERVKAEARANTQDDGS